MKFSIIVFVALCWLNPVNGFSQNLIYEFVQAHNTFKIRYDPRSVFDDTTRIACVAYFTGIGKKHEQDFPIAKALQMEKNGIHWVGKIDSIPASATAIIVTFADQAGETDNNNGKGYWWPLYIDGKIKPGAWSGIADLLYGDWDFKKCPFFLGTNLDSARVLYLRDFSDHPEMKRHFLRQYLATWKLSRPEQEKEFVEELQTFESLRDINETELQVLRQAYMRLNDTVNANKIERKIIAKFPSGPWAMQSRSLKLLIDIGSTRDIEKQKKLYRRFKENYFKSFPDDFTTRAMNGRMAQMLSYMAKPFAEEGNLNQWFLEVDNLQDEFKCAAYKQAAWEFLGIKGRESAKRDKKRIGEHPFYSSNLAVSEKIADAELMARAAVNLWRKIEDAPRRWNEPPRLTDIEVKKYRDQKLGEYLEVLGISLMNQNKFEESVIVLTEAVQKNGYGDESINQSYVESLVKSGKYKLAYSESEKIIKKGKSTEYINFFFSDIKKHTDFRKLKSHAIDSIKESLRGLAISEAAPDLILFNSSGGKINLPKGSNSIVVIEFWASWCPSCLEGLKSFEKVAENHKNDSEIQFFAVNVDTDKERALRVMNKHENKSMFAFDTGRTMVKRLGVNVLPSLVVINKKGIIKFRSVGLLGFDVNENANALEAMIQVAKN
jgi:thiol-disulfide isomerase/thioredoxin